VLNMKYLVAAGSSLLNALKPPFYYFFPIKFWLIFSHYSGILVWCFLSCWC